MAVGERATNAHRYQLYFTSAGRIGVFLQNNAGTQTDTVVDASGVNYSANTWYHAAAVFTSTTSRTVYRDGANSATGTASVTVEVPDTTNIGVRFDGGAFGAYLNGQCAEAGVWNVALTAGEIAQLAKGLCPLMVRPDALVAYWPLYGNNSPEDDWIGDIDLTITGATKATVHPRIIYPTQSKIFLPLAAGGTTFNQSLTSSLTRTADLTKTVSFTTSMAASNTRSASLIASMTINQAMSAAISRAATLATQYIEAPLQSAVQFLKGVVQSIKSVIRSPLEK